MIITSIRAKGKGQRGEVCSGEEVLLEGDLEILLGLGWHAGDSVDEETIRRAKGRVEEKEAYNASLRYLTFKDRTEQEVQEQLKRKGFDEAIVQSVLDKLKELNFLDDEKYALRYVKDRWAYSDSGSNRIKRDLEKKGIRRERIQSLVEEYCPEDEEIKKAKELAGKLEKRYEKDPLSKKKEKMGNVLQGKGYPLGVIFQALGDLEKGEDPSPAYEQELKKNLRQAMEKAKKKSLDPRAEKAKVIQRLVRKGYSPEEIQTAWRQEDDPEDPINF